MNREPAQQTDQFSNRESVNRGPTDVIDEKVMSLMNALYSAEMTVDEFIQTVEKLIVTDKVVFERLVQFMSDEIRYVGKYPNNEARITAEIVGMMLNRGFFMRVGPRDAATPVAPFGLIMRGILEALRRPPTTKLFRFGVIIVEQVLGRIIRWPQLCGVILTVSTFKSTYPAYFDFIEASINLVPVEKRMLPLLDEAECLRIFAGPTPKVPELYPVPIAEKDEREMHATKIDLFKRGKAPTVVVPQPVPVAAPVVAAPPPTVDQLLNDPSILTNIPIPPDWFQEQTATLFNILCVANLEDKINETRTVLEENKIWIPWFGYYLVKNRVSKETNQHPIYLSFIDGLKLGSALLDSVTGSTFNCLRVLLSAVDTSATHRSVLKNLGAWLGQITIARNKVIKTKDLDLKQLLLESYEKGKLTTTLPLVCRIMSCVTESRVFKPPNPWTVGILAVLGELHDISHLRTNLVFEIEILFKKLEISLPDIKRTELLAARVYPEDSADFGPSVPAPAAAPPLAPAAPPSQLSQLTQQLKQLQANWMSGTASNAAAATASAALNRPVPLGGAMRPQPVAMAPPPPPPPPPAGLTFADTLTFPNLAAMVSIPPSVALFQIQPKLRPLVPLAIERAIREIINAVAERSVTISCLTAREIVLKDFACEADESVVRKSAQLMVGCLAGSLALVTCREPFRAALANHLKAMLLPTGASNDPNELALVEQVVSVVSADNIDLGCTLMERAVYERATREVCETISLAIQARRLHREQQSILASSSGGHYTATPFVDPVHATYLLPGNLKTQHLSVYREFRDLMVRMETNTHPTLGPHPGMAQQPVVGVLPVVTSPQHQAAPPPPSGIPTLAQVQQLLNSLRVQAESQSGAHVTELKTLLGRTMNDLVLKLATSECLVTLPEIVDSQPFQLDSYYGLISLGFQAEWLEFLRKSQSLIASDAALIVPVVWTLTNAISARFDKLASLSIPLSLPPDDQSQSQLLARTVGSAVTEEHLFVELALAVLSLVPGGAGSLHTPIMAWILEMLFTKLNDNSSDQVKSAMLSIVLGVLRYNLTKESEMDRMLAKLLTDHRTIGTTGFVVYLLQTFTCRMRMSPLSNWPITTEVIYKMLQRVTSAGSLIPPNEKSLAAQLDGFAREMRAVANVSPDRIGAYRQLHCLGIRPPEPLPWDIVANQALVLTKPALINATTNVPVTAERRAMYRSLLHENMESVWARLRQAGCELDNPGPAGPTSGLPDWTEGFFQTIVSELAQGASVEGGLRLLMGVCMRTDLQGHEPRPMDIIRCRYVRRMWDVVARELAGGSSSPVLAKILAVTLHEILTSSASGPFSNAILSHFAKILYSIGPQSIPLFTFSWFELIANRDFMPLVLGGMKGQRGWWGYVQILQQGFGFVAAAIDQVGGQVAGPTIVLVEGLTKLLQVLNADFPDFLAKFADELVHDIHPSCVRARNILLAAIPRGVVVPNPFAYNNPHDATTVPVLAARVAVTEKGMPRWTGSTSDSKQVQSFLHANLPDLNLVFGASPVRGALVCGLLNLLRHPSRQTDMYVQAAEQLFQQTQFKEDITKAVVERLRVDRPHPWGLLVLFSHFVQKPELGFWGQSCLKNTDLEKSAKALALLCFPEPGPSAMLQKVVAHEREVRREV